MGTMRGGGPWAGGIMPGGGVTSGTAPNPSGGTSTGPSKPVVSYAPVLPHTQSHSLPRCRFMPAQGKQQPEERKRPTATASDAKRARAIFHLCLMCSNEHAGAFEGGDPPAGTHALGGPLLCRAAPPVPHHHAPPRRPGQTA